MKVNKKAVPSGKHVPGKPSPTKNERSNARPLIVAAILLVTFVAYFPSLRNELLKTWDDQAYVTKNELVKSLSADSILKIFREDRGLYANYHPLTTLSLAVNYHFSKEDPFGYHLTNLFFHLLNTFLVFLLIFRISGKNLLIAAITSLLFGITPIHVESVAWVSERKDVLYAFFFLASLLAYLDFIRKQDWKLYGLSVLLFLCAMLSKAMAASLPLVLILIDLFEKRRWSLKSLVEKVPFFIVAILLGIYAIRIQASGNAIGSVMFPLGMRIFHACYGFSAYIFKTIIPAGLSAFYPYPYPLVNSGWITNNTPAIFYLTLISSLAIFSYAVYCLMTNSKNLRILGFGLLFYAVTIALVLQFLPVGRAIMADRYAYIPSVGLFFILAHFANLLYRQKAFRIPVIAFLIGYAGFVFFLAIKQTKVWENDGSLWSNVIRLYPMDNRIAIAYTNRAQFYQTESKPGEALKDLLVVAEWNSHDDNTLEKIGKIYGKELHDMESSIKYFQLANEANPKNIEVLRDLSTAFGITGNIAKSVEFSMKGLELKPDDAFLLYNAGVGYSSLGQVSLGQQYIKKAVEIDPSYKRH